MTSKRTPVTPSVRIKVFIRDGHRCVYCGASAPDVELHVDHVIPVCKGGTNDIGNLVTACRECNAGKSGKLMLAVEEYDAGVSVFAVPAEPAFFISVDRIAPDPGQPRKSFDEESLALLAESLRDTGQIDPVRVRWDSAADRWVLVDGERRWRAAQRVGIKAIKAIADDADLSKDFVVERKLIESAFRVDLSPLERAEAYRRLMAAWGVSQSELAKRLNISESKVSRTLAALGLPADVRDAIASGKLGATVAVRNARRKHEAAKQPKSPPVAALLKAAIRGSTKSCADIAKACGVPPGRIEGFVDVEFGKGLKGGDIWLSDAAAVAVAVGLELTARGLSDEVPDAAWEASRDCDDLIAAWLPRFQRWWKEVDVLPPSLEFNSCGQMFEFAPTFVCRGRESCDIGPEVRVLVVPWFGVGHASLELQLQIRNAVISGYIVPTMILMGPPAFFYGVLVNERYKGTPRGRVVSQFLQPADEWENRGWYPDENLDFDDLRAPFFGQGVLKEITWDADNERIVGVYWSCDSWEDDNGL